MSSKKAVFQKVHNPAMAQPVLTVTAAPHPQKEPKFPCRKNAHKFKARSRPLMLHHGVVTSGRQHGLDGTFFVSNFCAGLFSRSLKQDAITLLFVSYSWPLKQHYIAVWKSREKLNQGKILAPWAMELLKSCLLWLMARFSDV